MAGSKNNDNKSVAFANSSELLQRNSEQLTFPAQRVFKLLGYWLTMFGNHDMA